MLNIFVGLTLGTSFGFLLGAIMTHAKYADERIALESFQDYKFAAMGEKWVAWGRIWQPHPQ